MSKFNIVPAPWSWPHSIQLQEHNIYCGKHKYFSDPNGNQLDADQLFVLCHQHDSDGSLKISVYYPMYAIISYVAQLVDLLIWVRVECSLDFIPIFDPGSSAGLTPLMNVVAEVFSHHGQPICSVSLSGVAETWIFCDRIVTAVCVIILSWNVAILKPIQLQWQHFYVPDGPTRISSPGISRSNLAELKNRDFLAYFKKHRGNLK